MNQQHLPSLDLFIAASRRLRRLSSRSDKGTMLSSRSESARACNMRGELLLEPKKLGLLGEILEVRVIICAGEALLA